MVIRKSLRCFRSSPPFSLNGVFGLGVKHHSSIGALMKWKGPWMRSVRFCILCQHYWETVGANTWQSRSAYHLSGLFFNCKIDLSVFETLLDNFFSKGFCKHMETRYLKAVQLQTGWLVLAVRRPKLYSIVIISTILSLALRQSGFK